MTEAEARAALRAFVADAGLIRERLAADGKETDTEAVRQAFLRAARGSAGGLNAGAFVQDKAAWLATGDPRAVSDAPRLSRVQFAVARSREAAHAARRVERAVSWQQEGRGHYRSR
jgi:hypothetical protein